MAMQNHDIDPNVFICFFDMSSLLTNAPLDETIKIYSDTLYDDSDLQPLISRDMLLN